MINENMDLFYNIKVLFNIIIIYLKYDTISILGVYYEYYCVLHISVYGIIDNLNVIQWKNTSKKTMFNISNEV